jgi:hypothetical protein
MTDSTAGNRERSKERQQPMLGMLANGVLSILIKFYSFANSKI